MDIVSLTWASLMVVFTFSFHSSYGGEVDSRSTINVITIRDQTLSIVL